MIERSKLNNNAHQKPSTSKPGIKRSANKIINALITKRKSPNVTSVIGRVSIINIGLSMALRIASTTAKIIAVVNLSYLIPSRI